MKIEHLAAHKWKVACFKNVTDVKYGNVDSPIMEVDAQGNAIRLVATVPPEEFWPGERVHAAAIAAVPEMVSFLQKTLTYLARANYYSDERKELVRSIEKLIEREIE